VRAMSSARRVGVTIIIAAAVVVGDPMVAVDGTPVAATVAVGLVVALRAMDTAVAAVAGRVAVSANARARAAWRN